MNIQILSMSVQMAQKASGKMNFFVKFLYDILQGINSVLGSYGWSIVIFTILMRFVLLPLDLKAKSSTRKIGLIQPQIKEINEKYKNDPDKRNKKTLELYQQHKINPFGGCLPMLIQLPIFFALFAAMGAISDDQIAKGAVEPFLWIKNIWIADRPNIHFETKEAIAMFAQGANGLFILPILAGITSFFQMKLTSAQSSGDQMKGFAAVFPLISVWFCYMSASSFATYWVTSNLFQIIQQVLYNRIKPAVREDRN